MKSGLPSIPAYLPICIALVVASCGDATSQIPLGAHGFYRGNIIRGEAFGAQVGMHQDAVQPTLKRHGITFIASTGCDYELATLIDCNSLKSDKIEGYDVTRFMRHGNLYVIYRKGRVAEIVWNYYLLPYIDF